MVIPAELTEKTLIDIIRRDKKAVDKWPKFVLLEDIGSVYVKDRQYAVDVSQELVEKVLGKMY